MDRPAVDCGFRPAGWSPRRARSECAERNLERAHNAGCEAAATGFPDHLRWSANNYSYGIVSSYRAKRVLLRRIPGTVLNETVPPEIRLGPARRSSHKWIHSFPEDVWTWLHTTHKSRALWGCGGFPVSRFGTVAGFSAASP